MKVSSQETDPIKMNSLDGKISQAFELEFVTIHNENGRTGSPAKQPSGPASKMPCSDYKNRSLRDISGQTGFLGCHISSVKKTEGDCFGPSREPAT